MDNSVAAGFLSWSFPARMTFISGWGEPQVEYPPFMDGKCGSGVVRRRTKRTCRCVFCVLPFLD